MSMIHNFRSNSELEQEIGIIRKRESSLDIRTLKIRSCVHGRNDKFILSFRRKT
jgi:hypothetical protein